MSIVANLEGVFSGIQQCKNSDYFQAVFNFPEEVYGKIFDIADMPNPKRTKILCESNRQQDLLSLQTGKRYKLLCSLKVRPGNNGYPASLGINILNVKPCG